MNANSKTSNILVVIAVLVLLVVSTFASYAYFNSKISEGDGLSFDAEVIDAPVFSAYTLDPIELNVSSSDMQNASNVAAKSDEGNIIVVLSSPKENYQVSCSYNIELVWDSEDQYVSPSGTLTSDYPYEISLKAVQNVTGDTTGNTYQVNSLTETNLTNFTWTGTAGTIGRKATVVNGATIYSKSLNDTTATWTFTINFYSLPFSQTAITGKSFGAHLAVTDVVC